ncbi:MAG TPA: hypothetical protein VF669_14260 [Tepidisphaeraceae bacterium]|jgi:hypothetical protein
MKMKTIDSDERDDDVDGVNGGRSTELSDAGSSVLSKLTLNEVEQQVVALPEELSLDRLLLWLDLSAVLIARAKQMRARVEEVAIEWIDNNGPITIGTANYTVAHPTIIKCVDAARCFDLVMQACNGDVGVFCAYLRADPFKYGSVRELLGQEVFQQVFRTEFRPKLVEGKPRKRLKMSDERFLR